MSTRRWGSGWVGGALALLVGLAAPVSGVTQSRDGGQGDVAEPPARIELDVMTFNIRTSNGRDGDNRWPFRKDLVVETIEAQDPDVLGLQEALADQIEYLEEAMPQYRWLGVDRGLNGGRGLSEATPIFYRHEELVPIESGTFWLNERMEPPPPLAPNTRRRRGGGRIVTWARFLHVETRRQVFVYNTHFTLRRGRTQLRSAEQINAHIAEHAGGNAVVVMGDFNAVAGEEGTWEVATSAGLRDAWIEAEERTGPPLTSNGFYPPNPDREGRIDWVLVGGPVEVLSAGTVIHSREGRFPSDHYPVVAKVVVG